MNMELCKVGRKMFSESEKGLVPKSDSLKMALKAVLEKYHLDDNTDDILTQLRKLDEDAKELSRLDAKWKNTKKGREKAENQKEELTTAIEAVLKKYHVFVEGQPYNVSLESLRNNLAAYKTAEKMWQITIPTRINLKSKNRRQKRNLSSSLANMDSNCR